MPPHQQVTTCRKTRGPLSKYCTCEHCNLSVCAVCGAYEAGLTTDCPGTWVNDDRQREVYETLLDYTDERGWHQGAPAEQRSPRFTSTPLPPPTLRPDPRTIVAPSINWPLIDHQAALQHELAQRAIAWVLADRACDELSASLARTGSEETSRDFHHACQHVEACDDELRQAARQLTDTLEAGSPTRTEGVPSIAQDPTHVQQLIRRARERREWDATAFNEGRSCDPADYIDGWNDALDDLAELTDQLEAAQAQIQALTQGAQERTCPLHTGAPHGGEAEELRSGIEGLLREDTTGLKSALQRLLDRVNARDSLAHLERGDLRAERDLLRTENAQLRAAAQLARSGAAEAVREHDRLLNENDQLHRELADLKSRARPHDRG